MMWTAVVPLKKGKVRKTRLGGRLSPDERAELGERMAAHVLDTLSRTMEIGRIIVLSSERDPRPDHDWCRDMGRGLNPELEALRAGIEGPMLVIHGDLPLVSPEDVAILIAAAGEGVAIAPDRHDSGTNALALARKEPFAFAFGEGSFARHQGNAGSAAIVRRPGLAIDVDTPEDLDAAIAAGFAG